VPHLLIEYSANLDPDIQISALVDRLHAAAIATGVFPVGGARTRAMRRDVYRVADGDPANAFVHLTMRVGHGRSVETRRTAAAAIFRALCDYLQPIYGRTPLAISAEMQEIDPAFSFKQNNLHERLARSTSAGAGTGET
jgi:5-carboxymethyl-2-hydroxymuconate isomerase